MQSMEWLLYTLNFLKQQCEYDLSRGVYMYLTCLKLLKAMKLDVHVGLLMYNCTWLEYKTTSSLYNHVFAWVLKTIVYSEDWELIGISVTISSKSVLKDIGVKE